MTSCLSFNLSFFSFCVIFIVAFLPCWPPFAVVDMIHVVGSVLTGGILGSVQGHRDILMSYVEHLHI